MIEMFQDGGPFMWAILVCGVFGAAIAAERMLYLYGRAAVTASAFIAQIQKLVMVNAIDRAIKVCNGEPHAPVARVVKAGLLHANEPEADINRAVEEAQLEVGPLITRRSGYLGMLANVSTLLGLLGTIQGLILAFDAVAKATGEDRTARLAEGISVAMYTTFFGLLVAIPILVVHALVQAQTIRLLDEVDELGVKTVNLLAARRRGLHAEGASRVGE